MKQGYKVSQNTEAYKNLVKAKEIFFKKLISQKEEDNNDEKVKRKNNNKENKRLFNNSNNKNFNLSFNNYGKKEEYITDYSKINQDTKNGP